VNADRFIIETFRKQNSLKNDYNKRKKILREGIVFPDGNTNKD